MSLAALGGALRRSNRRSDARERLREALDDGSAERRPAAGTAGARRAGGLPAARRRARDVSGPASLTPAEHRVAVAAAAGASNREIAQTLFVVGCGMVETHLTSCYRKLGISSRAELADAIRA